MSKNPRDSERTALLVLTLARLLRGCKRTAVGAQSPVPCAAAFLARELGLGPQRITVLGSRQHNDFSDGGRELFDRAAQGRIDAFFLGGAQVDGQANVNLVETRKRDGGLKRFPGSFGSAYLYYLIPNVILFREIHTRETLVSRVDFISAPGVSDPGVYRTGGPRALVTELCVFSFDRTRAGFSLESVHPWSSREEVRMRTGFRYTEPESVATTPPPDKDQRALLAETVDRFVSESYPEFARRISIE